MYIATLFCIIICPQMAGTSLYSAWNNACQQLHFRWHMHWLCHYNAFFGSDASKYLETEQPSTKLKLWPQFSKKWLTRSPKIALVVVLHCERTRVVFTELAWLICKVATGKIKMFSPASQEWSGGHAWHFCWDSCMCQLVAKYPLKASHVQVMRGH